MNETKQAIKSKTIWVNAILLALKPLGEAAGIPISDELIAQLLPLVNILLRMVTSGRISS